MSDSILSHETQWFDRPGNWFFLVFVLLAIATIWQVPTHIDVRFALMAQDVSLHGFCPMPTVNGVPYGDYFAPWVWLSWLTTCGGRFVHVLFLLILPSILALAWTACLLFRLSERFQKGTGALAVLLLFLNYEMLDNCMSFGLDIAVMAFATTMYWIFEQTDSIARRLSAFLLLGALAFVVRGPLGLVVYGLATGGYLLGRGKLRDIVLFGVSGAALMAFMLALTWYVFIRWGQGSRMLWDQMMVCQFGSRIDSKEDPWFYFVTGFFNLAPASAFMLMGLRWRHFRELQWRKWLVPILLTLVVMTIPGSKKLRYVMVLFPMIAMLGAAGLQDCGWPRLDSFLKALFIRLDALLPHLLCALMVVFACGCLFLLPHHSRQVLPPVIIASVLLFVMLARFSPAGFQGHVVRLGTALLLLLLGALYPAHALREDSTAFVRHVDEANENRVYFLGVDADHEGLKFLLHTTKPEAYRFIDDRPVPRTSGTVAEGWRRFLAPPEVECRYSRHLLPSVTSGGFLQEAHPGDLVIVQDEKEKHLTSLLENSNLEIDGKRAIPGNLGHRGHVAYFLKTRDLEK